MLCHLWWCKVAVQEGGCMCCSSELFAFGLAWLKAIMSFGTGCNRFQQNLNQTCQFSFYPELMQRIHLMNFNCLERLMMRLGFVQMFSKDRINGYLFKKWNNCFSFLRTAQCSPFLRGKKDKHRYRWLWSRDSKSNEIKNTNNMQIQLQAQTQMHLQGHIQFFERMKSQSACVPVQLTKWCKTERFQRTRAKLREGKWKI